MNLIFDREWAGRAMWHPQDGDLITTQNGNRYRIHRVWWYAGSRPGTEPYVWLVRQRLSGGDFRRGGALNVTISWLSAYVSAELAENLRRAVAAVRRAPDEPLSELTEDEARLVQGAIRLELRHEDRKLTALTRRFGEDADLSGGRARIALLESAYRKLGGDPARITNRTG